MSFLAHIELAEVRHAGGPDWLPDSGTLSFFFDSIEIDPIWGGFLVLWTQVGATVTPTPGPPDQRKKHIYKPRAVRFDAATSYPNYERFWHLIGEFEDDEVADVEEQVRFVEQTSPAHQIGGYPRPIQSDSMEAECQRAWNRRFSPDVKPDPADPSPAGSEDWRLLLQLDSDDEMGTNWADGGTLYFWIREQDARAGDFSQVWVTIQYY